MLLHNKGSLEQSLIKYAEAKNVHIDNKNLIYFIWCAQVDKTVHVHAAVSSTLCANNVFTYRKPKQAGHNYLYSVANLLLCT